MEYKVSSGQTSTGITLGAEDSMTIFSTGLASNTDITSGGMMLVKTGGSAVGVFVYDGYMYTEPSAYLSRVMLGSEGALYLSARVSVIGSIDVQSGAVVHVHSGGGSGVSYSFTNSGAKVYVHSGGIFDAIVRGSNSVVIFSGAMASKGDCIFHGNLILSSGGTAIDTDVYDNGVITVSKGGVNSNAQIGYYGSAIVKSGGVTYGDHLAGKLTVSSGGTAVRTKFMAVSRNSGDWSVGSLTILHGGVASEIEASYSGKVLVHGELRSAIMHADSFLTVSSGGRAYDVVVDSSFIGASFGVSIQVGNRGLLSGVKLTSESELTVLSGGTAENVSATANAATIIVSKGGSLSSAYLWAAKCNVSGGTATGVGVDVGGFLNLFQGKVSSSVVSYGGFLHISGGSAVQTSVSGGLVHVSGGIADGVEFDGFNSGILHILSTGTATNVSVVKRGFVSVYTGGLLSGADVRGGVVSVDGGRAEDIRVSSGYAIVNYGSLGATVVSSGGSLVVSGGIAAGATVLSGGYAKAEKGSANSVSVVSGGILVVDSDAACTGISAESGAKLILHAGTKTTFAGTYGGRAFAFSSGLVSEFSVYRDTTLNIDAGASAIDCHIFSSGSAVVNALGDMSGGAVHSSGSAIIEGGQARAVSVLNSGIMMIKDKGTVRQIDVNGRLTVSSGGYANNISVHSGGSITISRGGSANAIALDEGAFFIVELDSGIHFDGTSGGSAFEIDGNKVSGFSFRNGTVQVANSASMVNGTAGSNARILVSYGGVASGITVSSGGSLSVSSGASLNGARILSGGSFYATGSAVNVELESGAVQNVYLGSYTLLSGSYAGSAFLLSGGIASAYAVHEGYLSLAAGASANEVTVLSGGSLSLYSSANVTNATVSSGGMLVMSCFVYSTGVRSLNGVTVHSGGTFYLNEATSATSGYTSATGISADSGAMVRISEFNAKTFISGTYAGSAFTIKDGLASGYTVHSGGLLGVSSEGTAKDIRIESGGSFIMQGGIVSGLTCDEGTYLLLHISSSTTVSGSYAGSAFAFNNGTISSYQVHSGQLTFNKGCSANRIDVLDGGLLYLPGNSCTVGYTTVSSGGRIVVSSAAMPNHLTVLDGGRVTGKMTLTSASDVTVSSGGIVFMDLAEGSYSDPSSRTSPYISDLSMIKGVPTYYLRFAPNYTGTYTLAKGAAGFNGTITVQAYDYTDLCTLTVGQSVTAGGFDMSFTRDGDTLYFTYNEAAITVSAAKSDVDGNGISDVLFQYTGGQGQIGFWMNGTSTWQSTNATHPVDTWEVLGAYDMDSNGKADSVLVGNVVVNGIKGAFVGYYVDANDTDANWVNISYLTNNEGYVWKNKVGNLTGNAGKNSIVWHSTDIGALGVWTDGTDNWVSLGAGYDKNWTLVGCGDFDGDGRDEVVMSYLGGAKYYTVGIDGAAKDLATSDSGWTVRAIGDFSGDGKDDIVAFHKETGLVAKWGDGNSANWSKLGQLDPKDWFIAGAGDYNGDGKDDLLVRQNSTGMLGYYSSGDMAQWNVLGYGVDMSWTVIA